MVDRYGCTGHPHTDCHTYHSVSMCWFSSPEKKQDSIQRVFTNNLIRKILDFTWILSQKIGVFCQKLQ